MLRLQGHQVVWNLNKVVNQQLSTGDECERESHWCELSEFSGSQWCLSGWEWQHQVCRVNKKVTSQKLLKWLDLFCLIDRIPKGKINGLAMNIYLICVMDWMFVSYKNSYVETLPSNVTISGGVAFGRSLGLNEVMRVHPSWIRLMLL